MNTWHWFCFFVKVLSTLHFLMTTPLCSSFGGRWIILLISSTSCRRLAGFITSSHLDRFVGDVAVEAVIYRPQNDSHLSLYWISWKLSLCFLIFFYVVIILAVWNCSGKPSVAKLNFFVRITVLACVIEYHLVCPYPCLTYKGMLISPSPDQEGNKLQRPNSGFIRHTPHEAQ